MLARSQRLSRRQFTDFFKAGTRYHSEYATIVFVPYPTLHGSVVVSKKVARLAVRRNQLRRRVYHQLQIFAKQKPGVYIVILKPTFSSLSKLQARTAVETLLQRTTTSKK